MLALDVNTITCVGGGNYSCRCMNSSSNSSFNVNNCTICDNACSDGVYSCDVNVSDADSTIGAIVVFSIISVLGLAAVAGVGMGIGECVKKIRYSHRMRSGNVPDIKISPAILSIAPPVVPVFPIV